MLPAACCCCSHTCSSCCGSTGRRLLVVRWRRWRWMPGGLGWHSTTHWWPGMATATGRCGSCVTRQLRRPRKPPSPLLWLHLLLLMLQCQLLLGREVLPLLLHLLQVLHL